MLRIVFHFYLVEFIIHRIHIVYGELIQLADNAGQLINISDCVLSRIQ